MSGKKKGKAVTAILLTLVGVLFVVIAGSFLLIHAKLNKIQYSDGVSGKERTINGDQAPQIEDGLEIDISGKESVDSVSAPDVETIAEDNVLNVLILGTDERGYEFSDNARADCIMVLSLNKEDHSIKLISLERGMGVEILDGPYKGKVDLLTHCFHWGGADLMLKEVSSYFKLDIDKYVRVNFSALAKIINILGGIDVELTSVEAWYLNAVKNGESTKPYRSMDYYVYEDEPAQEYLKEGTNHLYGSAALAYSRLRRIDSDWQRVERQRNVLQAVSDKAKEMNIKTLNKLCDEILPMVQTNFSSRELLGLIFEAPKFVGKEMDELTVPVDRDTMGGITTFSGGGAFAPDYELNAKVIQEFIYGTAK